MTTGKLSSILAAGLLTACGGAVANQTHTPNMPRPKANFFLRTGFDADPSAYLGRFVPDAATAANVDDANAAKTACSQYYRVRKAARRRRAL